VANFTYSAMTKEGKSKKGKIEAGDKNGAIAILKDSGYYPISVTEETALTKDIVIGNPVKIKDITIFCQQFEAILTAGISVLEALDLLKSQTENKFFRKIIADVYTNVEAGDSLSGSMRKHSKYFPSILVNMVEAGEASGNLEIALKRMAEHFEKEYKLKQNIKKATMYPMIVSIIALGVVIILLAFVIPTFVQMFTDLGAELPPTTKALIGISDFVVHKWYILVGIVVFGGGGFAYFSKTDYGKMALSGVRLKMPLIGKVNVKIVASRFSRTMSTLLASGLPILDALEIVSKVVDNYKVEKGFLNARDQVSKGVPLSKPIEEMDIFPPMITHMVKIGENTGQLEPILNKVADFYDGEVDTAVSQLTTMLEPMIIVFLAVVVGFVVISIVQPMFGMYGELGSY
jgi:type IV pilus assembly protein PilC